MIGPTSGHATVMFDRADTDHGPVFNTTSPMVTTRARSSFGTRLTPKTGQNERHALPVATTTRSAARIRQAARTLAPPGSTLRLTRFVVEEYNDGRSPRAIRELGNRSEHEVVNVLNAAGVPRRPVGASRLREIHAPQHGRLSCQGADATKIALIPGSPAR